MNIVKSNFKFPALSFLILVILLFALFHIHKNKEDYEKQSRLTQLEILVDSICNKIAIKNSGGILNQISGAMALSNELNDSISICKLTIAKAGALYKNQSYDSSYFYSLRASQLANTINNDTLVAKANILIGHYFLYLGDNIKAAEYYSLAWAIVSNTNKSSVKALICNSLGVVYNKLGDFETSIKYYLKALELLNSKSNYIETGHVYYNLALAYNKIGDSLSAWSYFNKSSFILKQTNDTNFLVHLLVSKSLLLSTANNTDSAMAVLKEALELSKKTNSSSQSCIAMVNIGKLYCFEFKDYDKAKCFITKCRNANHNPYSVEIEMESLLLLSDIEEYMGKYLESKNYYRKYVAMKDSIGGGLSKKGVIAIELYSELLTQEFEARILEQNIQLKAKKNEIAIITLTVFILLLLTGIYLIHISNKNLKKSNIIKDLEKQRINEVMEKRMKIREIENLKLDSELMVKKKELIGYSVKLITKNDLLNKISTLSLSHHESKSVSNDYYNSLQRIIEENSNIEEEWNQFKELFEKIHHDFFSNLQSQCPNITKHELRFCAYLKIGLSTKEISRLLNITPETVRKFKCRLKKKLITNKGASIEAFLDTI